MATCWLLYSSPHKVHIRRSQRSKHRTARTCTNVRPARHSACWLPQVRADDGGQVSEHVLPALMKVNGELLAGDLMVLNFGLHFNTQSGSQQYLWHIDAVAKFVEKHKVSMSVKCSASCAPACGSTAALWVQCKCALQPRECVDQLWCSPAVG